MTRQQLRVFLGEWFCGCGSPELAAQRLLDILKLHPLFDHRSEFDAIIPDDGVQMLMLYTLDHLELTEHGGSVGGGWLTDTGKAVLGALLVESQDGFAVLFEMACVHGYSVETELDGCPECSKLNAK